MTKAKRKSTQLTESDKLARAFKFNANDLKANRAGKATGKQQFRMAFHGCVMGSLVAVICLVFGLGGFYAITENTDTGSWIGIVMMMPFLLATVYLIWRVSRTLFAADVNEVTGKIHKVIDYDSHENKTHYLRMKPDSRVHKFLVSQRQFDSITTEHEMDNTSSATYTVYYLASEPRKILSLERL
jgi:hypothetical protein